MFPPNTRVLADVSGQVQKARVVSRIDCGDPNGSRSEAEKVRDTEAYVVRLSSGQRITLQGRNLTATSVATTARKGDGS